MSNAPDLKDRSAVVTGASSGIGRAIAESLGASGAHVVLCGRTESAMKESVDRIAAAGGTAEAAVIDVCEPGAIQGLIDAAVAATGHLDIFVNNAGVGSFGTILGTDVAQWRTLLETNVLALMVGCKAAVSSMRSTSTRGHIVNISSIAAKSPDSGIYGASKHAVNVVTNSLRLELIDDPIQLTTVMPGVVATNFARYLDPAVLEGFAAMVGDGGSIRPGERLPDEVLERAQVSARRLHDPPRGHRRSRAVRRDPASRGRRVRDRRPSEQGHRPHLKSRRASPRARAMRIGMT